MPGTLQIGCINKTTRSNAHERIRNVGGTIQDGARWQLSQEEAIAGMESGRWQLFMSVNGKTVWVIVATSRFGHKYLKTESDGEQPDNLLNLPECPLLAG